MNSNELNNYINELNSIEKNELKIKLENFYIFNNSTISFFKGIDEQFRLIISQNTLDAEFAISIHQKILQKLDTLSKTKRNIIQIDKLIFEGKLGLEINQLIHYIKNIMLVNEVESITDELNELLKKNEDNLFEASKIDSNIYKLESNKPIENTKETIENNFKTLLNEVNTFLKTVETKYSYRDENNNLNVIHRKYGNLNFDTNLLRLTLTKFFERKAIYESNIIVDIRETEVKTYINFQEAEVSQDELNEYSITIYRTTLWSEILETRNCTTRVNGEETYSGQVQSKLGTLSFEFSLKKESDYIFDSLNKLLTLCKSK